MEADFHAVYQVDPLNLSWRKFLVLLRGLPSDSRLHNDVFMSNPKNMLDVAMGRDPNRPKQVMTLEEFQADI